MRAPGASGCELQPVSLALDRVAADLLRCVGHHLTYARVSGRNPQRRRHLGLHGAQVECAPAPDGVVVALGLRQALEQAGFELCRACSGQLDGTRRVAQHLDRFDSGDVVEEPATRREHSQCVALELEQLSGSHRGVALPKARDALPEPGADRRTVARDHAAVRISRRPGVAEQGVTLALEHRVQLAGEPVQALPQRCAPALVGGTLGRDPAAAVGAPSLHAMRTAPGAGRDDVNLLLRRVTREKRREVFDACMAPLELAQQPRQRNLSKPVVVAEGLPVGRDRHQAATPVGGEEPLRPVLRVANQAAERHVVRDAAIVHEQRDRSATAGAVRSGRSMGRCPFHLVRRENREPDPFGREDIERLGVDRRFGQPHPGGLTPKAAPEVGDPPPDLRHFVAPRGEGENGVMVGHGDRAAVAVAGAAHTVGL